MERFYHVFQIFKEAGFNLYLVGGCVRDALLDRMPKDFDFTCDCLPEQTIKILEDAGFKTFSLGQKFGTVSAHIGDQIIEITTHRNDLTQGRHPDVAFTKSLEEDLARRDFTINSMAQCQDGTIIDFFGGQTDIQNRTIRATGNAYERFAEDPLRMLRAMRFVSQLGFSLDATSRMAIYTYSQSILSVSRERWLEELNKLLLGINVREGLELLKQTGLLGYVLPEVFPITLKVEGELQSKNLWDHTKLVVSKATPTLIVRWAALLHDIGKPQTRRECKTEYKRAVHFFGHEQVGADLVESIARRLHMSNGMREEIKGLVLLHQRIGDIVDEKNEPAVSPNALRRMARDCEDNNCRLEDLIELFAADCSSSRDAVKVAHKAKADLLRAAVAEMREEDLRPRLPKGIGVAIMEKFGLPPGRKVGEIKARLEAMLLDGRIRADMPISEMLERFLIK